MRIDGVIEYVLNGRVQGWVRWPTNDVASSVVEMCFAGLETPMFAQLVARDGTTNIHDFRFDVVGLTIEAIASGEVSIIARHDAQQKRLAIWHVLRLAHELSTLTDSQRKSLQVWHELLTGSSASLPSAPSPSAPIERIDEIEPFGYGSVSADSDAVVGRNGFLFLGEGSNRVKDLYVNEYPGKSELWMALFSQRRSLLEQRHIKYIQIVLPEKASALAEHCPFPATRPSSVLAQLIEGVAAHEALSCLTTFPLLHDNADAMFMLTDSHLSSAGARAVVERVLETARLELPEILEATKILLLKGDLGSKFRGDWRERVSVAEEIRIAGRVMQPKLDRSADPPAGGHKGIERVWSNSNAPFNLRVIAFSNSFFERGAISTQISWWFARLFSEFHFIWSPKLDIEYVDQVNPDLVVCQTIERFLRVVPDS